MARCTRALTQSAIKAHEDRGSRRRETFTRQQEPAGSAEQGERDFQKPQRHTGCIRHRRTDTCERKQTRSKESDEPAPFTAMQDRLGPPRKQPTVKGHCPVAFRRPAIEANKDLRFSKLSLHGRRCQRAQPSGNQDRKKRERHRRLWAGCTRPRTHAYVLRQTRPKEACLPRESSFACRRPSIEATKMGGHDDVKLSVNGRRSQHTQ